MRLAKAWTAIDRLSIIKQSNLFDEIKRNSFPVVVVSILIYGCTSWTLTKRIEKKQVGNCTRMLRAICKNPERIIRQNSCCTSTYLPSKRGEEENKSFQVRKLLQQRLTQKTVPARYHYLSVSHLQKSDTISIYIYIYIYIYI